MNEFNSGYFAYRRGDVVTSPESRKIDGVLENMVKLIATLVGEYNSMVTGLHLGYSQVMTFHHKGFQPKCALIGSRKDPIPVRKARSVGKYHSYETAIPVNSSLVQASDELDLTDFVFQIGVRDGTPACITTGLVVNLGQYAGESKADELASNTSEAGSGVFNYAGQLIGMTLGQIHQDDIMVARRIGGLFGLDLRPIWNTGHAQIAWYPSLSDGKN